MVIVNAPVESLHDLISLSYKLDQLIDKAHGSARAKLVAMRDRCDDSVAELLGLDDSPATARPSASHGAV